MKLKRYSEFNESIGNRIKTFAKDAFKFINGKSVEDVRSSYHGNGDSNIIWFKYLWDYILGLDFLANGWKSTLKPEELHERLLEFGCYETNITWDADEVFGSPRSKSGGLELDLISLNSLFDFYNIPFDEEKIRKDFKRDPLKYSNIHIKK